MCKGPTRDQLVVGADDARPLLHRYEPFSADILTPLGISPSDCTYATVDSELYSLACAHVAKLACQSFKLAVGNKKGDTRGVDAGLGLGLFEFAWEGHNLVAIHQEIGDPVGSDCGATFFRSLVLLVRGRDKLQDLLAFTTSLVEEADRTDARSFTVYRYNIRHSYWARDERVRARPLDSVVLPSELKSQIVDDLDDFTSPDTQSWYTNHGIPYRRAFLFFGAPGSGKTSLLQAIAGRYGRNLCYLSPTHPDMTDDSLKNAVSRAPAKSLIVLEDIDALFGADRSKKIANSPLTFSGLLNALDGVGQGGGQLFVLTSNHREQLDPALVRAGRVDLHVHFDFATPEQMAGLFSQFYPECTEALPKQFADALVDALGERRVSMAALQHYFILSRKTSAEKAAAGVALIVKEHDARLDEKASAKTAEAEAEKEAEKEAAGKDKSSEDKSSKSAAEQESNSEDSAKEPSPHIHVHLHGLGRSA